MENHLYISDAAKEVKVESHVLRYWEEELHLPIKRNELGHRYYTQEDVERFKQIKGLKERGLQLKAIKMILRDGKLDVLPDGKSDALSMEGIEGAQHAAKSMKNEVQQEQIEKEEECGGLAINIVASREQELVPESKEEKTRRLQWILQQLIRETLQENNSELCREIKESVVKELDYQFRMQEEREEARDKRLAERDEEHYKRMDELLRKKAKRGNRHMMDKKVKKENKEGGKEEQPISINKKKRHFIL